MGKPYLFVHGAMRGAWLWEPLIALMGPRGAECHAIDLPGHGKRAAQRQGVTLSTYVNDVVSYIDAHKLRDVILVGHSMGGVVISKVAEEIPEKLSHLVYIAAVVLEDGGSLLDGIAPERAALYRQAVESEEKVVDLSLEQRRELHFTDLEGEQKEFYLRQMTPQPAVPFAERVSLKKFYGLNIPKTYILGTKDQSITPDRARVFARRIGCQPIEINGGHDLMVSRAQELAEVLLAIPH